MTVPNGVADTATFAFSSTTHVTLSADTQVGGIVFNGSASPFTITAKPSVALTIDGVGITNDSGLAQNFVIAADAAGNAGQISFSNGAAAANGIFLNNSGPYSEVTGNAPYGLMNFYGSSSAGHGTFTNSGGVIRFYNTSTAGNGTFTNNTAPSATFGGSTQFYGNSIGANSVVINNGGDYGGTTTFGQNASAGNATLIAYAGPNGGGNGGLIRFNDDSDGGTSSVEVFGNGQGNYETDGVLDVSGHNAPGATIGSLEGTGTVLVYQNTLTVGTNNRDTKFSGRIEGYLGSLSKTGKGKLTLTRRNTYTGRTTVEHGALIVNNSRGSGTGSGPVQVNAGKLGGKGTIAGRVNVGTGNGPGAILAPGYETTIKPGTLTIQSALTFNSDSTFAVQLNSTTGIADKVSAHGVTINGAAQVTFTDLGNATVPIGTVFTVIDNTSGTPIAGHLHQSCRCDDFHQQGQYLSRELQRRRWQ